MSALVRVAQVDGAASLLQGAPMEGSASVASLLSSAGLSLVVGLSGTASVLTLTGEGLDRLLKLIDSELEEINTTLHLTLPIDKHDLAFELSKDGKILGQESGEHVVHYTVSLPQHKLEKWTKFK
jgi:50S ribosomal subunit-associated GTPase HflX